MEWGVVAAVGIAVLVIFGGAKKLPEMARSVGRAQGEFKKGIKEGYVEEKDGDAKPADSTTPDGTDA